MKRVCCAEQEGTVLCRRKQLLASSSPWENVGSVASELPKFQEKLKTQRFLYMKKKKTDTLLFIYWLKFLKNIMQNKQGI